MRGTGTVTDLAVASYLAKYSTKGTEATGHASARITDQTIDLYANPAGSHPERLIAACWRVGQYSGYASLRRWAHMLGFGGHFLTKARRYSIRFRDVREARVTYRRSHDAGPNTDPSAPRTTPTRRPRSSSARSVTPGPDGRPSATRCSPTPLPTRRKRRQAGHDELADEYNRTATGRQAA